MGNEITLKINVSCTEFENILKNKGFILKEDFVLRDLFFVKKTLELEKMSVREILKEAILLREFTGQVENRNCRITFKEKNINEKGEILSQNKIEFGIDDLESAKKLLNIIGYNEIMQIIEHGKIYEKDGFEIEIKDIKNGDNLIEVEVIENDERLDTIEKVKDRIMEFDLPIDISNLFVKKAEIELEKILNK